MAISIVYQELGFDLHGSAFASTLPWIAMAMSANFAGWLADTQLMQRFGLSRTNTRKFMQSVGFLGPAICLTLLPTIQHPAQAIGLLMISQGMVRDGISCISMSL